ncbi:MAG TPA: hypothetical protein VGU20_23785 [Stellaceae bacterium]|nr:hypothetical protein [Stellaceae bacterium]
MLSDDEEFLGLAAVVAVLLLSLKKSRTLDVADLERRLDGAMSATDRQDATNLRWRLLSNFKSLLNGNPPPAPPNRPVWFRGIIEGGR